MSPASLIRTVAVILAAMGVVACTTSGGTRSQAQGPAQPEWILNPALAGHVSVVGSAPPQAMGPEAQRRVAEMKARQELALMIRVRVEAEVGRRTTDRGGTVTSEYDQRAVLSSRVGLSLSQARVHLEWMDPVSGHLYLWIVTPE